jgi:hypothetical protein
LGGRYFEGKSEKMYRLLLDRKVLFDKSEVKYVNGVELSRTRPKIMKKSHICYYTSGENFHPAIAVFIR